MVNINEENYHTIILVVSSNSAENTRKHTRTHTITHTHNNQTLRLTSVPFELENDAHL